MTLQGAFPELETKTIAPAVAVAPLVPWLVLVALESASTAVVSPHVLPAASVTAMRPVPVACSSSKALWIGLGMPPANHKHANASCEEELDPAPH